MPTRQRNRTLPPARDHRMPLPLAPMLAKPTESPPVGEGWAFELKWDGIRAIASLDAGELRLRSRTGEDITHRYPELPGMARALGGRRAILDGEIVAFDPEGHPSFQLLQRRLGLASPLSIARAARAVPAVYIAFDLVWLNDRSLLSEPYEERRRLLAELELDGPSWQTPRHHLGDGAALLSLVRERQLEGIIAKRLGSPYRPGRRSADWLKVANRRRQDFLIGGWMPGSGSRAGRFGSLLVGYWDATPEEASRLGRPQRLVYAGRVGSGFKEATLDDLTARLAPLRRPRTCFDLGGPQGRGAVFCEPRFVCSVEFARWTDDDTLRAPVFKGLSDDRDRDEVLREP